MQRSRSSAQPLVQDVMRADVIVTDTQATLAAAVNQMDRHGIGCMPVLEGKGLVGMVTDRDILVRGFARQLDFKRAHVKDVMSAGLLSVRTTDSLDAAEELMLDWGVRRLIVVDRHGELAGLLSAHDLAYGRNAKPEAREVSFYRWLLDSHGHAHKVETCRFYISPGVPQDVAEPLAIERFEQASGGHSWRSLAEGYEVFRA